MRIACSFAFISAILLSLGTAKAQVALTTCATDSGIGAAECRVVVESVYAVETGTYSDRKYDKISVTCYYPSTIANVCAGGGDFDRSSRTGLDCRNHADGAYLIQDAETGGNTQCFQRQNFGLNGVVDARQCGVVGDGLPGVGMIGDQDYHPDDAARLNVCITSAQATGYHIVTTGGGAILDNTADIEIPNNMMLTCGGTSVAAAANNDYRIFDSNGALNLSKAIVVNPTTAKGGPFTIRLTGKNPGFTDCTVVAGAGPQNEDGSYPNQFSPQIWYPNCDPDPAKQLSCDDSAGQTYFRSAMLESSAFNPNPTAQYPGTCAPHCGPAAGSTGVTVDGSHAIVRDVTVLGFGTCISIGTESTSGPGAIVDQVTGDCNTGIHIFHSNAPFLSNIKIGPDLTQSPYRLWTIEKIDPIPAGYKVTARIDDPEDSFRLMNGDTVWIGTGIGGGRESARGRWTVSDKSEDIPCPLDSGLTCQSFTLTGSRSLSFAMDGRVHKDPEDGTPANAITLLPLDDANLKLIGVGQKVTDSAGCLGMNGTSVDAVWPAQGIVYVHDTPTCTPASPEQQNDTITFTDNPYTFVTDCHTESGGEDIAHGCVFIQAGFRFGDGFDIHDTGGTSIVNCAAAEHMVAFHANTGANNTRLSNCASDSNVTLPERNLASMNLHTGDDDNDRQNIVGLLIDGAHNQPPSPPPAATADACEVKVVNSRLGQHRAVGAVVNTFCDHDNELTDIGFGVSSDQGNAITAEIDRGTLGLANNHGTSSNFFMSGESTLLLSSNHMPNVSLYLEDSSAAASTSGCGNVFSQQTPGQCANVWSQ